MKKIIFLILMFMPFLSKANHWQPDPYQFESNMTVTAVLHFDDIEQRNASIEIGAFYDGVCRGSSKVQYVESLDRYYIFMMIYGYHGDSISFKCYDHNRNIELDMICKSFIEFKSNDIIGNASNPFIISFDSYIHHVNIDMIPEMTAIITGDGEYKKYDTCFISITPNQGYQLDALMEGADTITKQQSYSFIVLSDREFVAHLSEIPIYYQINAYANPETGGTVLGTGEYLKNETCTLQVITHSGYDYVGLYENDELVTTDTTYTFTVNSNRNFIAHFKSTESIDEIHANDMFFYPNPASDFINISGLEKETEMTIYDLMGKVVLKTSLESDDNMIDVSNISNGTYIIAVDGKFNRIVINR